MRNNRNNIPGPDNILRKVLPNGIIVLIRENPESRTASMLASMPCGAYLDPMDKTGLADFMAYTLNTGTQTHDFNQISELLECSGASLSVSSGPKTISFRGGCLAEDLSMLLRLLREIADEPAFPEAQVEIHRRRVLTAYEMNRLDPEYTADERFDELLFGNHPYGRPEYGVPEQVNAITREDLFAFHRQYMGPKEMTLAISAGIPAEEVLEMCEKQLGTWQKEQQLPKASDYFFPCAAPDHAISEHIEIPGKSEMYLMLGTMGPDRKSTDYFPAILGNNILGEFGMMGRIGKAVRGENGLAYYAGSSVTSLTHGGAWDIDAGTNPANVEKVAEILLREIRRFTTEKVSEEELEEVKSFFLGSMPLTMENNHGIAALMLSMENNGLGLDYLLKLENLVQRVTTEDVLETARKWLDPEKLIRVTAGTATK